MISFNALTAEYETWTKAHGLTLSSADEHLNDPALTQAQREWLSDFSLRWDMHADAIHKAREGLRFDIPADAWEATGSEPDERTRLLTTIRINSQPFHLEAIAVRVVVKTSGGDPGCNHEFETDDGVRVCLGCGAVLIDEGELEAASEYYADDIEWLYMITGGPMGTQTIEGREYILHAAPFSP